MPQSLRMEKTGVLDRGNLFVLRGFS
uniref:Uncharacterized protein n=1 Tax=Rhizophora mucronata TaxID=61149 RepID=A0A2P2PZV9_RHIMU